MYALGAYDTPLSSRGISSPDTFIHVDGKIYVEKIFTHQVFEERPRNRKWPAFVGDVLELNRQSFQYKI